MGNPLFDDLFGKHADSDRIFIAYPDGSTLLYRDFVAMTGRYANALKALGVTPGDRVAAQVAKSVDALAIYGACARSGAAFLPLNTAYTPNEITYFLNDATPRVFICDPSSAKALTPIAAEAGAHIETLDGSGSGSIAESAAIEKDEFATVDREADDLAAILYTSGTTGRAKGAMLSQTNLLSNGSLLADVWQFTADDVLLHALPIFHTHGLFVATNTVLSAGAAMIWLPKFDADEVVELLPRATAMMGVPTFYTRLLGHEGFTTKLCKDMRLFTSGSAPLLAETHREFEARTGHRILERYGMTETNMNTSNPYDGDRRAGTVGFPLPKVELRVVDADNGVIVTDGEIGVIEVRGPNVFKGYWQMPEKTAEEFRPDGFFITGDLGRIDEDGYVTIVGRGKDLIITGGFNVYPKEIETAIDAIPGVLESAVIGTPHPDFGEAVVAVIILKPGSELDADSVKAALSADLAKFKQPKRIIFLNELPRNTMGKVQKNVLRDEYAASFAT